MVNTNLVVSVKNFSFTFFPSSPLASNNSFSNASNLFLLFFSCLDILDFSSNFFFLASIFFLSISSVFSLSKSTFLILRHIMTDTTSVLTLCFLLLTKWLMSLTASRLISPLMSPLNSSSTEVFTRLLASRLLLLRMGTTACRMFLAKLKCGWATSSWHITFRKYIACAVVALSRFCLLLMRFTNFSSLTRKFL